MSESYDAVMARFIPGWHTLSDSERDAALRALAIKGQVLSWGRSFGKVYFNRVVANSVERLVAYDLYEDGAPVVIRERVAA